MFSMGPSQLYSINTREHWLKSQNLFVQCVARDMMISEFWNPIPILKKGVSDSNVGSFVGRSGVLSNIGGQAPVSPWDDFAFSYFREACFGVSNVWCPRECPSALMRGIYCSTKRIPATLPRCAGTNRLHACAQGCWRRGHVQSEHPLYACPQAS